MSKNVIIYAAVVIVLGIGATVVAMGKVPFTDTVFTVPFLEKSPDQVIETSQEKMLSVESLQTDIGADMIFESVSETTTSILNQANIKAAFSGSTDMNSNNMDGTFSIEYGFEGGQFDVSVDVKTIDQVAYLRLTELPNIPGFDDFIDLNSVKNVWFKFDADEIIDGLSNYAGNGLNIGLELDNINSVMPSEEENQAMISKIQNLATDSSLLKVDKRLPDDKIDEVKTYHYTFHIDKEELENLAVEIVELSYDSYISGLSDNSFFTVLPADYNVRESIQDAMKSIGDITGEIWIGKKDFFIRQYTMTVPLSIENQIDGRIAVTMKSSNFNEPVTVEEPVDSENIVEFIMDMFAVDTTVPTDMDDDYSDYDTDTDEDGLVDYLEEIYETDPGDPDTDADGYKDGEEVDNGYNPLGEGEMEELSEETLADVFFFDSTRKRTRDGKRAADLRTIQTAVELYINDNGVVPLNDSDPTWEEFFASLGDYMASSEPYVPPGTSDCDVSKRGTITGDCYVYCENGEDYLLVAQNESFDDISGDLDSTETSYKEATDCVTSNNKSFDVAPDIDCDDPVFCLGTL